MWTAIISVSPFSLHTNVTIVLNRPSLRLKVIFSAPLIVTKLSSWSYLICLLPSTLPTMTSCWADWESKFGIKHLVKSWFSTYLRDRVTKVSIDGDFSDDHVMRYSLPQGSIIGPHGFIYIILPLLAISCVLLREESFFVRTDRDCNVWCKF